MAKLVYLPPAEKYLKKIKDKKLRRLFKTEIEKIRDDYTIGKQKSGDLRGIYGYDIYYNKTNYEIAYKVEFRDGEIVIIIMAGSRENFYDELKRYLKTL